jgi:hypothetical protein
MAMAREHEFAIEAAPAFDDQPRDAIEDQAAHHHS